MVTVGVTDRAADSTCSTAARVTSFRHSFIHSILPVMILVLIMRVTVLGVD